MPTNQTAEQQKVLQRLAHYIEREQLVGLMNDTKWRELQSAMVGLRPAQPRYRVKSVQSSEPSGWERDWATHLGLFKSIEWVDVDPIHRERRGKLVPDLEHDMTDQVTDLLGERSIPYEPHPDYIRIHGYRRTAG